jgi:hypothetical protein
VAGNDLDVVIGVGAVVAAKLVISLRCAERIETASVELLSKVVLHGLRDSPLRIVRMTLGCGQHTDAVAALHGDVERERGNGHQGRCNDRRESLHRLSILVRVTGDG